MRLIILLSILSLNFLFINSNPVYREAEFMEAHLKEPNHNHYNSSLRNEPLKIHLIAHTHDDVRILLIICKGWMA